MPKVSVLITYHNDGDLIHRAITSVLNQTFSDFELLILTDTPLPDIVRHGAIKVIETPDCGVYGKWNIGVKQAQGEFIAFCPADDEWYRDKLQWQLDAIGNKGMCVHQTQHVGIDGKPYVNERVCMEQVNKNVNFDARFKRGNIIFACTVMYRKSLHDSIGYFDETITNLGDLDFYIRANRHSGIAVLESVLSKDRVVETIHPLTIETYRKNIKTIKQRYYA